MENSRAREYFEQVRHAAVDMANISDTLEELRFVGMVGGVSYDYSGGSGSHDVMAAVDNALVSSSKLIERMETAQETVDEALVLLYGKNGRSGISSLLSIAHADMMCARYCQAMSWGEIANELSCSRSWPRKLVKETLDYIDRKGFARVWAGVV